MIADYQSQLAACRTARRKAQPETHLEMLFWAADYKGELVGILKWAWGQFTRLVLNTSCFIDIHPCLEAGVAVAVAVAVAV